jgi:hypothetical protein
VIAPGHCPACAAPTSTTTWHEPALLIHGGYGATRRTTMRACGVCDWSILAEVCDARPQRL